MTDPANKEEHDSAKAAAAFALVLVVIGLPVWWTTTTVYRAALPYSLIDKQASKQVYHKVHITIVGERSMKLPSKLGKLLKSKAGAVTFAVAIRNPTKEERSLFEKSEDWAVLENELLRISYFHVGTLAVYVLPEGKHVLLSNSSVAVGFSRLVMAKDSADLQMLYDLLCSMTLNEAGLQDSLQDQEAKFKAKVGARRQVPTRPGYDITLILMLPQPHLTKVDWNVEDAVNDYLNPIVGQLAGTVDLKIRSQVLYMTSLKVSPTWSSKHKHYILPEVQLPLTINAIEAKLGSFVSTRPSLHFIVYIPTDLQTPLQIYRKDGFPVQSNSFLVPRWGGVIISNPHGQKTEGQHGKAESQVVKLDTHHIMSIMITQLLGLLPVPFLDSSDAILVLKSDSQLLAGWQLDALARARILSYLGNIRTTLQSLCDLVGEISNMVVSDEVAGWVWGAVDNWKECGDASREGRLQEAMQFCTEAFEDSDAAFFHPSMLALLYFPDNQKYAIYVPLFLPVSIPVFLSLRMIFRHFKKERSKEKCD